MTKTTEGYGCQREVYHPYSKLSEPGAVLFYESSDEEDEVGKVGSVSLVSIETKSSPKASLKASPKASPRTTIRDAIVLRGEDATETKVRSSPGKTAVLDAGDTSMEDIALESEEKTVEVEMPAGDEDIVMLDAILTASPSKPSTVASPSQTIHSPAAQPSTPPRPKRTPFDVLTPENTFGASSPFKIGSSGAAGKSLNKTSPKAKENYEVPGGFNDDLASEVSQGTSIIFSDTQGFFASLFLFVLTFALDVFAYSMAQHEPEYDELEDGWGVSICYL
ncbi:uncharacterized protein H6S33_008434 [Morchella sextelata]|uniref:uncharacterized protein n=1 Tax=Morchella sextelata TaxID=1174677 RepID=UPI001D047855|nr:uncharacterized protein H6S33_008434 [Morchella sextelata]KAH0602784.1 hypothetical protein H6S33_008434 [Morchella sextelata]